MPPTPQRLHDLLLACGFDPAQLERITQQSMGTGLDAITTASDPAERARAIVDYASRYGLVRELAATVLTAGADKPALQNVLLGDNMSLEDGRTTQNIALDLAKLESRVERMFDKLDAKLDAAIVEMRHLRADAVYQPITLTGKAIAFIVVALAAMVVAQISLLAWVGTLPHG